MRGLRFRPAAVTVLVLLGCHMLLAAQPPDLASARQQFLQAMAQAQRPVQGPAATAPATDATDDPALRSYPLYPYLQAERIRQAFNDRSEVAAADRRAAGFLATYGLLPVGIAVAAQLAGKPGATITMGRLSRRFTVKPLPAMRCAARHSPPGLRPARPRSSGHRWYGSG